jgi:hypothetical protein
MPLDFPNVPTNGQVFNAAGVSWMWDGVKWISVLSTATFLPLTGGIVTGNTTIQADSTGNNAIAFTPTSVYNTNVPGHQMQSQMIVNTTGGTSGEVYANTTITTAIQAAPNNFIWNNLNIIDYHGTGGSGQHVASYNQAIRRTVNAGGAPNNPSLWGAVFEVVDYSNTPTATLGGTMNGIEIDMTCGNVDNNKMRRGIGIYINKASPSDVAPTVDTGLHMAGITGHFLSMIRLESYFDVAAIDLRTVTPSVGAHTIWMKDGTDIAWNTAGTGTTSWDASMFSGAGGVHFNSNVQIDGTLYIPNNVLVGNALTAAQEISGVQFQVGSTSGPTWTTGSAVPSTNMPVGSIYSRVGGAVGATLYVSRGGGTWAAVAGV